MKNEECRSKNLLSASWKNFYLHHSYFFIRAAGKSARVTAAIAKQAAVAAFRPWRGSLVHTPQALAEIILREAVRPNKQKRRRKISTGVSA
jgi:hypothetical protein